MKTRTIILGGKAIEVEEYGELGFGAKVDVSESDVKVLYKPKTIELRILVDGMIVASMPAKLGEAIEVNVKVKHEWFVMKKYATLTAMYPGGDPVIVKRKRWKRLGRLGWLSEYESREELEKSADSIILVKSGKQCL